MALAYWLYSQLGLHPITRLIGEIIGTRIDGAVLDVIHADRQLARLNAISPHLPQFCHIAVPFTPRSVGALSEAAMNIWNDTDVKDDQKIWSSWTMHSPNRSPSLTNYVSAFVFTLAAVVVMAGNVT